MIFQGPRTVYTYYIALGSNMGDKNQYLDNAIQSLREHPLVFSVHEGKRIVTSPWGNTDQDEFLNSLCVVGSYLSALEMLDEIQRIERDNGRERRVHWGPRTLDLDIIWIEDEKGQLVSISNDRLEVPHPYFWDRSFVLEPLQSVYEDFRFNEQTIAERITELT